MTKAKKTPLTTKTSFFVCTPNEPDPITEAETLKEALAIINTDIIPNCFENEIPPDDDLYIIEGKIVEIEFETATTAKVKSSD